VRGNENKKKAQFYTLIPAFSLREKGPMLISQQN
jgi:hypothetical protein